MITVFTPTYNRAYTLNRLYESLKEQSCKNFEWLVVDDGSTDNTQSLFKNFCLEREFPVRYVKQENHGKQAAVNRGVELAKGNLFFIVDSDDYLTVDAIEKINQWESSLPSKNKFCGIAGLVGLRGTPEGTIIGTGIKSGQPYVDASAIERSNYGLAGDKAEVFFTDVLKQFPFVIYENENFITEDSVWLTIALNGYKMRWYNEVIYICEYLDDGLTNNGDQKFIRNPKGTLLSYQIYKKAYPNRFKIKASWAYRYYLAGKANGENNKEIARKLEISRMHLFMNVFMVKVNRRLKKLWRK